MVCRLEVTPASFTFAPALHQTLLGDEVDIETIPRIGYRFTAPVIIGAPAPGSGVSPPHNISDPPLGVTQRKRWPLLAACITLLALTAGWLISPEFLANLHAQLGQRDQALALLEEGYRQRSPQVLWIQTDPAYEFG